MRAAAAKGNWNRGLFFLRVDGRVDGRVESNHSIEVISAVGVHGGRDGDVRSGTETAERDVPHVVFVWLGFDILDNLYSIIQSRGIGVFGS